MERRALITGASSGIGEATARALAARGAHVTLLARRADRVEALASELGGAALVADVGAPLPSGDFDLVVANAGVMLPAPAEDASREDLRRMLDANLVGLVNTVQAAAPGLLAAGEAGRPSDLVVVSSIAARRVFDGYAAYSASKAGATAYAEGVRAEWARRGVRVTTIEPGLTRTELREHVAGGHRDQLYGMFDVIDAMTAQDVAEVIAFAVSQPHRVNLAHVQLVPSTQA
jgi:NADP-dependent 3-hydroxy acid dehydrogenase YdfG